MPYIKSGDRVRLVEGDPPSSPGELNYLITYLVQEYLEAKKLDYQSINDVLGALEGAKLEFYRRVVVPYESQKIDENGDVY